MNSLSIRTATVEDLPAVNDIYNHYVLHSTCTYQTEPSTPEERAEWFAQHGPAHPVIVAEDAGEVIGWGSLSRVHTREAYRFTVEDSIYVRHDYRGRGAGSALLAELIERARALGHHAVVGLIDAEQEASIRLHRRFGFAEVGRLRQVGYKFGRWLDVIYLQLLLG